MHSILGVVAASALAFAGTMIDNFFAFSAQLLVTDPSRRRRVSIAQALGVATLVVLATVVGSLLASVPSRWIGVLAIAPWALALHAWRHRHDHDHEVFRRGAVTTFALTLALGGDNLAVWIPLLRTNGSWHVAITIAVFAVLEAIFIVAALRATSHPSVVSWGDRHARQLVPWIYLALGLLILFESRTF